MSKKGKKDGNFEKNKWKERKTMNDSGEREEGREEEGREENLKVRSDEVCGRQEGICKKDGAERNEYWGRTEEGCPSMPKE